MTPSNLWMYLNLAQYTVTHKWQCDIKGITLQILIIRTLKIFIMVLSLSILCVLVSLQSTVQAKLHVTVSEDNRNK